MANSTTTQQKSLPNSTLTLVMGISSVVSVCCCYYAFGLVGIALGIVALINYKKDMVLYTSNPEEYTLSSYNNLKVGRICGIVGLVLSSISAFFLLIYVVFMGGALGLGILEELKYM